MKSIDSISHISNIMLCPYYNKGRSFNSLNVLAINPSLLVEYYEIDYSSDTKKYIAKCVKAGAVYHKGIELCITSEITKKVTYERIKYNI